MGDIEKHITNYITGSQYISFYTILNITVTYDNLGRQLLW